MEKADNVGVEGVWRGGRQMSLCDKDTFIGGLLFEPKAKSY